MGRKWTEEEKAAAKERYAARVAAGDIDGASRVALEAETEFGAPEIVEPSDPSYDLFLASVTPQTRDLLSDEELREIYAAQLAKKRAEKKAAAKKAVADQAGHFAGMAEGMIPAAAQDELQRVKRNNELVKARIELPPAGDNGEVADIGLRIDQRIFLDGVEYTLTKAQWDSYREMLYRSSQMEMTFKGQNLRQRRWMMERASGAVNTHVPLNADGTLA